MTAVVAHRDGIREQQRDHPRQQPVLHGLDPPPQRRFVVAGQDRHRLLDDDRTAIQRLVDQVDRAATEDHAVRKGIANGVRARERRQQRRMGVHDPARERGEHGRAHHPHVPREDDDVGRRGPEGLGEGRVVPAGDERRLDPLLRCPVEGGTGTVGEDEDDRPAKLAAGRSGMQGTQVGAGTRDSHRDAAVHAIGPST